MTKGLHFMMKRLEKSTRVVGTRVWEWFLENVMGEEFAST